MSNVLLLKLLLSKFFSMPSKLFARRGVFLLCACSKSIHLFREMHLLMSRDFIAAFPDVQFLSKLQIPTLQNSLILPA